MLVCMHASVPYAGLDKEMNDCHAGHACNRPLLHKNSPNDQLDMDFFMQIKLVQILDPCLMQRKIFTIDFELVVKPPTRHTSFDF
jgi:hypothetical protein